MDEFGLQDQRSNIGQIPIDQQKKSEPKLALEAFEPAYYGVKNRAQVVDAPTSIL